MSVYTSNIIEPLDNGSKGTVALIRTKRRAIPEVPEVPEFTCSAKSVALLQHVDYGTSVLPESTPEDGRFALYMSVNGGAFEVYYGSEFIDIPAMFAKKIPSNMPLPRFDNNDNIGLLGYNTDGVTALINTWDNPWTTDPKADSGVIKRFNIVIKPLPGTYNVHDMFIAFADHTAGQVELATCLGYYPEWIERPVPPVIEPLPDVLPLVDDGSFLTQCSYVLDDVLLSNSQPIDWIFHYTSPDISKLVTYADNTLGGVLMSFGFPGIGYYIDAAAGMSLDVDHSCSHYSLMRAPSMAGTDEFVDYMVIALQSSGMVLDELMTTYKLFTDYVKSKYTFTKEILSAVELQIVVFALDDTSANLLIDALVATYATLMPDAVNLAKRANWNVEQKKVLYKLVNRPDLIPQGSVNGFDFIKPLMSPANQPFNLKSNWVINYTGGSYIPL